MDYDVLAPGMFIYPFPETLSKDLVNALNEDVDWKKSAIGIDGNIEQTVRTSQSMSFEVEMPIVSRRVKEIMVNCVNHYMQHHNINITQDEGLDLLRYEEANKYDYHIDGDWKMYRVISILIYLNPTEYQGGETHFRHFDLNVKPEYPSIVIFPSNYAYEHSAKPVESGIKYVIVTWGNDLPMGMTSGIMVNIAASVGLF